MMFTNWLLPWQHWVVQNGWSFSEDGYDRYAKTEYSREHRDYQRVIAERMRIKARKSK